MSRRSRSHFTLVALAVLGAIATPAAGQADSADRGSTGSSSAGAAGQAGQSKRAAAVPVSGWARLLDVDHGPAALGLPARESPERLARAALRRHARLLGLSRSGSGLRLAGRNRLPAAAGGRALTSLRFQQTVGGLRLLWSQLDVTVAAGRVSSISATVVPIRAGVIARASRITRARALQIARRAAPGAAAPLAPLEAAYAGSPRPARQARPRRARRVWVVQLQPPARPSEDAPPGLCVVVDASTGRVLARWPGLADRPDRGPARGSPGIAQLGQHAQLIVGDGRVRQSGAPRYATYSVSGDPRVVEWPLFPVPRVQGVVSNSVLNAASTNARNVARTICDLRGYCGVDGGFRDRTSTYSGTVTPWQVAAAAPGQSSFSIPSTGLVVLSEGDVMALSSANDVVAHEMGHLMDWNYAGDRDAGSTERQTGEVAEALGDMFAYEYDRFDDTAFEESDTGPARDWSDPHALRDRGTGLPYPDHMDEYDEFRTSSPHFHSTILSHAYWRFVQAVGHHRAGRVLHNVPSLLSPRPTFTQVANAFSWRAGEIYGSDVQGAARAAFTAVGLRPAVIPPEVQRCLAARPPPDC